MPTWIIVCGLLTALPLSGKPKAKDSNFVDITKLEDELLLPLDQDWDVYFDRHLASKELKKIKPDRKMALQKFFDFEFLAVEQIESKFATFRYRLHVKKPQILMLQIPEIPAYKLYVNNVLVGSKGTMSIEAREVIAERLSSRVILPGRLSYDIVLQTTNMRHGWFMGIPPISIGKPEAMQANFKRLDYLNIFVVGAMLITAVYQVVFFLRNRYDRSPLYFALFCLFIGARQAVDSETGFLLAILPLGWEWSWKISFIAYYLAPPTLLAFQQEIFPHTIPENYTKTLWFLSSCFCFLVLFTSLETYGPRNWVFHFITLSAVYFSILSLAKALKQNMDGAMILSAGFLILFGGTIHDILQTQQVFDGSALVAYTTLALIVCQSLILTNRFSKSFATVRHIKAELSKMVHPHVLEQISQGAPLERTMPTGTHEAVVLCFDVISSKDIKDPQYTQHLDSMLARIEKTLQQYYDPASTSSNAYRLQQWNDGMMITVGFPFHIPTELSKVDHAYLLAEELCYIFRKEMESMAYSKDLYCGVGITIGDLEGRYPKSGSMQYDIKGRAVGLARHYQAMSKPVLSKHGYQGSVVFIQDRVYRSLSKTYQEGFLRWDCQADGGTIRDDHHAEQAWFKFQAPAKAYSDENLISA
ncbi:7TM-DISM domain-containing protein [Pseudobacteriovorax antillogorgiicola]|uniref:7TM-DISM domain-containing protein n=1 Tax=Pseudobacteriovorax antillogorgiicola TaxID=1513793 RepID=UPI001F26E5D6|nr:7TM-DISM domain-containing protein [Pseudobacteriovorax antillogorgiicola]